MLAATSSVKPVGEPLSFLLTDPKGRILTGQLESSIHPGKAWADLHQASLWASHSSMQRGVLLVGVQVGPGQHTLVLNFLKHFYDSWQIATAMRPGMSHLSQWDLQSPQTSSPPSKQKDTWSGVQAASFWLISGQRVGHLFVYCSPRNRGVVGRELRWMEWLSVSRRAELGWSSRQTNVSRTPIQLTWCDQWGLQQAFCLSKPLLHHGSGSRIPFNPVVCTALGVQ